MFSHCKVMEIFFIHLLKFCCFAFNNWNWFLYIVGDGNRISFSSRWYLLSQHFYWKGSPFHTALYSNLYYKSDVLTNEFNSEALFSVLLGFFLFVSLIVSIPHCLNFCSFLLRQYLLEWTSYQFSFSSGVLALNYIWYLYLTERQI